MAEKTASNSKHRHVLRTMFLLSAAVGIAIVAAVTLLNRSLPGEPPAFSPSAGLFVVLGGLLGFAAVMAFYMRRTDEHDMIANLWGLSIGYLFFAGTAPVWWMLHHSGLVGPVNFWAVYIASALVASGVWGWMRFR
ncbi:MAG TPA: hypothetical protein VNS79_15300 [Sphingobium sp.]|nr:hypothetical protein [Sphingobium sp.]